MRHCHFGGDNGCTQQKCHYEHVAACLSENDVQGAPLENLDHLVPCLYMEREVDNRDNKYKVTYGVKSENMRAVTMMPMAR